MRTVDSWWLDVKLGLRMLIKYPGLALAGVAGIALVVAIASGAYSVIYTGFLVSSLPLDEGDRIVSIEIWDTVAGRPEPRSLYDYHVWRERLKSVREISAFRVLAPNLIVPGVPTESVVVASMSASGFRVSRVAPMMGRYFDEEDEREGAASVIVISESVWRDRFAADSAILGRTIQLGPTTYSVIGVMPKGYAFPVNHHFWIPLRAGAPPSEPLAGLPLMVFGRLAPGTRLESAQAEVAAIGQRTAAAFPKIYAQLRPQVLPYAHPFVGLHGSQDVFGLVAMQGFVVSLLVLVCLNVAILVYTRTAMRQAEIGLRTALGASRGRIVTQLFIEAFVLSLVAALAGVLIAALSLRRIASGIQGMAFELPFWMSFQLSPQAGLYALVLSVVAAAIIGVLPALQATRRGLQAGLRVAGSSGLRLGKTWTVLIVAQVCFAVALLPPAVSSAWEDTRAGFAGLGFAAEEFLSAQLGTDGTKFADRQSELLRRLEADPAVADVTFALANPGDEPNSRIEAQGAAETEVHDVRFNRVDVDFFRIFEVPILAGRRLESADIASGGAVVVNYSFAQKIFGGNALGRRIRYLDGGDWHEIVGIVGDFPAGVSPGMRDTPLKLYHAAAAGEVQPAALAIRMRGGVPLTFAPRLREIALAVDTNLYVRNIRGLDEAMRTEQWQVRLTAAVFAAITLSVLMLSSAGVYSLMSFTVSQRRKEIGIRMALGADWRRILASIFSRVLLQLGAGAALGAVLVFWFERGSRGVIMRGHAPVVLPAVALAMIVVGVLAALGPARRSLRIEPTEALREE
jgi:predicted permease